MRLFGISLGSLLAVACGLSMNPDLPSGRGDEGDGDIGLGGDGDGDTNIDTGYEPSSDGMGGCGGAGGALDEEDCTATP